MRGIVCTFLGNMKRSGARYEKDAAILIKAETDASVK